jgi:hypothetical protein
MKSVLNYVKVKHQNHMSGNYAELTIYYFRFVYIMLLYTAVSEVTGSLFSVLHQLNLTTVHVNCYISLPFELAKYLSSSPSRMLKLWKGAPCLLAFYLVPNPLWSVSTSTKCLLLSEATTTFILVNRMARWLDMGLLLWPQYGKSSLLVKFLSL